MSIVKSHLAVSLDGYAAGPDQSQEHPLDRARAVAGGGTVDIAGGAATVRQYLVAGLLDELLLHVVPVVLGAGERLLDGVGDVGLEQVGAVPSRTVTHLRYRVRR
jgi:dihydrofolate reductase